MADPSAEHGEHGAVHCERAELEPAWIVALEQSYLGDRKARAWAPNPSLTPIAASWRDFWAKKRCRAERAATRKGILFPVHRRHLVALPRISLNCDYQSLTQTALYLSGASFALWNLFQQSAPLDGRAAAST